MTDRLRHTAEEKREIALEATYLRGHHRCLHLQTFGWDEIWAGDDNNWYTKIDETTLRVNFCPGCGTPFHANRCDVSDGYVLCRRLKNHPGPHRAPTAADPRMWSVWK